MEHLTPARRRWAYRISAAALAVAAVYGVVSGEESHAWLLLSAALFGVADRNVNED